MRASVLRRIENLEMRFKPSSPELPPLDFSLLTESEISYFGKEMRLLRWKARELGYGDGPEGNIRNVGWFDLGDFDPVINHEVRMECLEALDGEERGVVETLREILLKAVRLTEVLSEEEKCVMRKFNEVTQSFGSNTLGNWAKKEFTEQDRGELRVHYNQIMAKYGEKVFE